MCCNGRLLSLCSLCLEPTSVLEHVWGGMGSPWGSFIPSVQLPAEPSGSLGSLTYKAARNWRGGCLPLDLASPEAQVGGREVCLCCPFQSSFWGRVRGGQCLGQLGERWHRPGISFLMVLVVGEGLRSQPVLTLFVCLELHKYHVPRPAHCRVSHLRHHYFGHKEEEEAAE